MLKITTHHETGSVTFQLEGKLIPPWVQELERHWQAVAASVAERRLTVDLAGVSFVDLSGKELLARMCGQGVALRGASLLTCAILKDLLADDADGGPARGPGRSESS